MIYNNIINLFTHEKKSINPQDVCKKDVRRYSRNSFNHRGNVIDSSLHLNPFIDTYLNLRSFKKVFPKKRLEKYRKENRCPVNENIAKETGLSLGHRVFLGTKKDMEDILAAIVKIQKNASKLKQA